MKSQVNKPVVDPAKRNGLSGLSPDDVARYLPRYLFEPEPIALGKITHRCLNLFQNFLILLVKIFLKPRPGQVGGLDREEVEAVYNREADHYDWKHHMTTRGKDTIWRRQAGWFIANLARNQSKRLQVLDLCTGTGLTAKEMKTVLSECGQSADVVCLDYCERMLRVARVRQNGKATNGVNLSFVRGDAMNLTAKTTDDLASFLPESFDAITQVFGIGGIGGSSAVFNGALQVLKPDGEYLMIDMHEPVASQPTELPFLGKWLSFPSFEYLSYHRHIMPVVLNRLWGWKDPTLDFYRLPLATWQSGDGTWWGFDIVSFEMATERWWFSLPLMPVGKIVVKKVMISDEEAKRRQEVLTLLS